jgi:hypothetical protein
MGRLIGRKTKEVVVDDFSGEHAHREYVAHSEGVFEDVFEVKNSTFAHFFLNF